MDEEDIAERGQSIYDRALRACVETSDTIGKVIVIDVDTAKYEIDSDHLAAVGRARERRPDAVLYATRVGFPALGRIGGFDKGSR